MSESILQVPFSNFDSVSKPAFVDLTATDLEASSTGALTLQVRKAESWNKQNYLASRLFLLAFLQQYLSSCLNNK